MLLFVLNSASSVTPFPNSISDDSEFSPQLHGAQEPLLLESRLEGHLGLLEVEQPDAEGEAGHVHREPAERPLLAHETFDKFQHIG